MLERLIVPVLAAACLAGSGFTFGDAEHDRTVAVAGAAAAAPNIQRRGQLVVTADWFDQLFGAAPGDDWDRDSDERGRRAHRHGHGEAPEPHAGVGHFRTMCVRLCDGFPIPMSFSTVRSRFAGDARRCAEACPGARLYVYPNPGGELADMVDLKGHPYRELPTAFLNQQTYTANCTCHGNPWDAEAVARHQAYAAAARRQAEEQTGKPSANSAERTQRARRWAESHSETGERR
ncbi:MAG TPA: DUF2865 domain-containing protein [Hyphomicrobiaceae bacterium]|nr:DUF2865 domain-containing protein [Hyphomicrobiaceae bacterium]